MLTIISVSYKSKKFIEMNYKLVKTLNPKRSFRWIIVQNTPESEWGNDIAMDDPRFEVIRGPSLTPQEKNSSFYRSIHHAKALNSALSYIDADLFVILDPDCFILMPNWIELVSHHIQKEKLFFFGVPYHPQYSTHYRRFPNAICLFINRRLMQENHHFSLDFMPGFQGHELHPPPESRYHQIRVRKCLDTGYRIFRQYNGMFRHQIVEIYAEDQRNWLTKLCETILPDRFRTYPRDTTYIKNVPSPLFAEFGEYGEQFFWENQIFAFHFKGVLDKLSNEFKDELRERMLKKIEDYAMCKFS